MTEHTPIQCLAIRALRDKVIEHIIPNLDRLQNLDVEITQGTLLSNDRTVFYIVIDGDCLIEARVSVHGERDGRHLVTVFFFTYRLPNSTTLQSPQSSFEDTYEL